MDNPLLKKFDTPYNTVPFSKIKEEHFIPAIEKAIEIGEKQTHDIASNPDKPTFENTIEAMQYSGELVGKISAIFFNLNSAETNEQIQKIAQTISPMLTNYSNNITLNSKLFNRISDVWKEKENLSLDKVQIRLLEKTYINFVRNGAVLNEENKSVLREIDSKLSKISLNFGENILAETNSYELLIFDENDLEGLPKSYVEAAKLLAKSKNKDGWLVNLDFPSYMPFMKYSSNRELRKTLFHAFGSRAFKGNEYDNKDIVLEIVKLRHKRANLLGYKTHAEFVLERRMAKTPKKVDTFLKELLEKSKSTAIEEMKTLSEYAKFIGNIEVLEPWDTAFYSEKLKKEKFTLDSEELKKYFKLENVIGGAFSIAKKLYDIEFEEIFDVDKYHEDVKTYKIVDLKGNFVAILYADFFPRAGKRGGAWMTSFKNQRIVNGYNERPHVSIVCNFTKPTNTAPSLLTFQEVTTLFHEFGHALHGMLSDVKYESLSGTNVFWDFVELPSQIFENWCYEKEALDMFAKHYKTGEKIPQSLIEKIKKSANFMEGLQTLRQLNFGFLDMAWHNNINITDVDDVKKYEMEATKNTSLFKNNKDICSSTLFSHIFQGGYSSGYYSYKWAEVLDADAFAFFKEEGIFSKKVASLFKENILSKGGTENPEVLYEKFRGRAATVDALLERAGLMS